MACSKNEWSYTKAAIRTYYGCLSEKSTLTDGNVVWTYYTGSWNDRIKKGESEDDCYEWLGSYHRQHYGLFRVGKENDTSKSGMMNAQRLAMAIHLNRPLKKEERVFCTCHNSSCTNPKHLRIGDRSQTLQNSPIFKDRYKFTDEFLDEHLDLIMSKDTRFLSQALNLHLNQAVYLKKEAEKRQFVLKMMSKFAKK